MLFLSVKYYIMTSSARVPTTKHGSFNLQDIEKIAIINKAEVVYLCYAVNQNVLIVLKTSKFQNYSLCS